MVLENLSHIQVQPNSVAIIGWEEGGAGFIHSWLEKETNHHIACFVNTNSRPIDLKIEEEIKKRDVSQFSFPTKDSFKDRPLINSSDWIEVLKQIGISKILCISGNPHEDGHNIEMARKAGLELISAIHPSALILEDAILADNVVVYPRAVIGYRAELDSGVIVNTGAQIDHHNKLKYCCRVDPGVVMAGNVTIGEFSKIHTGSVFKNKIRVGKNCIVGAGTVVIKDIKDNSTVVGVPARKLSKP